jgi:hypothetical protein
MINSSASSLGDILANKKESPKAPAHQWQDLALRVIQELGIPTFKRNSVFKVCKDYSAQHILMAMSDTKELASGADQWRYFFKVLEVHKKPKLPNK